MYQRVSLGYLSQSVPPQQQDYLAPTNLIFTAPNGPPDGGNYVVNSWSTLSLYTVYVNAKLDNTVKTSQDAILFALKKGIINNSVAYTWIDFIANPTKYASAPKGKTNLKPFLIWGGVAAAILVAFVFVAKKK